MTNRNPQEGHPQVRLRNRIMAASILLLAVVNCVAGYFDLHDTMAILFLNVAGVMLFVLAVVLVIVLRCAVFAVLSVILCIL